MNELIIMQGVPGSGKSFTAKTLAGKTGVVYSTDDFWGTPYEFDSNYIGLAHSWNKGRVVMAMKSNHPLIVVDNTNTTPFEWEDYLNYAKYFGYSVRFEQPTSSWWEEIAPKIKNKSFNDSDVELFCKKTTHSVPFNAIERMMYRFTFYEDFSKKVQ